MNSVVQSAWDKAMDSTLEHDLIHIRELLQHTREFIAYFELVERQMIEWQEEILAHTQQLNNHATLLCQYLQADNKAFVTLEQSIIQTQAQMDRLHQSNLDLIALFAQQQKHLSQLPTAPTQHNLYTVKSYPHIKDTLNAIVARNNQYLKACHVRFGLYTLLITFFTVFIVVLYLNNEMPWESHRQASNERHAGKILLHVWPKLTQNERNKILNQ